MNIEPAESSPIRAFAPVVGGPWYAVRTQSRHEWTVVKQLEVDGVEAYLPAIRETHRWSDRRKVVTKPLFPGYVFVRPQEFSSARVQILRKIGVIGFVGSLRGAEPIRDEELNGVRLLLSSQLPCAAHPYLAVGQRIRVKDGALRGIEGILVRVENENRLVVSLDLIERSLVVQLEGCSVQVV